MGKKTVKDHVETVVEHLPDMAELRDLKDDLVDRLPDEVTDRLPMDTPKKKRFRRVRKLALVGLITAAVAAVAAFVKAKMADDEPTYTASSYTPPGDPATPSTPTS